MVAFVRIPGKTSKKWDTQPKRIILYPSYTITENNLKVKEGIG